MLLIAGLTLNRLNHRFLCGTQKQSRAIIRVKAVTPACGETDWHTRTHALYTDKNGFWWHFITGEVHVSRISGDVPVMVFLLSRFRSPSLPLSFWIASRQCTWQVIGLICSILMVLRSDCALPQRSFQPVFEPLLLLSCSSFPVLWQNLVIRGHVVRLYPCKYMETCHMTTA